MCIPLPTDAATRVKGDAGRDAMLGIRPEDVSTNGLRPDTPILTGAVDSVLPVGSDRFLGSPTKVAMSTCVSRRQATIAKANRDPQTDSGAVASVDRTSGNSLLADVPQ
jgi:hypothetical protein